MDKSHFKKRIRGDLCLYAQKINLLKGLIMQKTTYIIAMLLVLGSVTYADCTYQGYTYPEGAVRGPYICLNGAWIRR